MAWPFVEKELLRIKYISWENDTKEMAQSAEEENGELLELEPIDQLPYCNDFGRKT